MMNEKIFVKSLIDEIKKDYNTPKISVERSIAPILSIFIEELLNHEKLRKYWNGDSEGFERVELYSKEFPIKKGDNNQSTNIDYLFKNDTKLIMVELKTSSGSFVDNQMEIYRKLRDDINNTGDQRKEAGDLIKDIQKIYKGSKQKNKYKNTYKFLKDGNKISSVDKTNAEIESFNKIKQAIIIYLGPKKVEENLKDEEIKLISFEELFEIELDESEYKEMWKIVSENLKDVGFK